MKLPAETFAIWQQTKFIPATRQAAWDYAFTAGWMNKAYALGLNDTHIETALKRIWPGVWK